MHLHPRTTQELFADPAFNVPLLVSAAANIFAYAALTTAFPARFGTEKAKAWILTGIAAVILTASSIPFIIELSRSGTMANDLVDSPFARALLAFFLTYLVLDLALGVCCYRSQIAISSGYFHHTLYAGMVVYLARHRLAGAFCSVGFLELPTLILAAGQMDKRLRHDMLFGATFFATRIVAHTYFIVVIRAAWPETWNYAIAVAVLPLHVMWFKGWISQQIRIRRVKTKTPVAVVEKEEEVVLLEDVKLVAMVIAKDAGDAVRSEARRRPSRSWASSQEHLISHPGLPPLLRSGSSLTELNVFGDTGRRSITVRS